VTIRDLRDAEFTTLYENHYLVIFRYVLVSAGPGAEDLVAETFQKAYFAWRRDSRRVENPRAWLLTIARRVVIDAARRRGRRPVQNLTNDPMAPDVLEARETWMWFEAVTRDLPERARDALYLRFAGGLSGNEIGLALGMSASGVRTLIARALDAIRQRESEEVTR
jgi:RNA polymerase sigma-70 factor (ECF subfamily)